MFNIDIEKLMDLIDEETSAYFDYCRKAKTLYNGPYKELAERKKSLEYAGHYHDRAQDATRAVIEVLNMDKDQTDWLYIAGRAVKRWRIRTEWARLIPDDMKDQIKRFIFGEPSAPSLVCERCGCWRT